MSNPSRVIVVVEDDHHEMLVRRYLLNCGIGGHAITIQRSPSGSGSAEKWVREIFAKEVARYRRRQAKAETAFIVVIDADSATVNDRLRQLDQALKEDGSSPVDTTEQIARLVPKRNVETWILCLNNVAVDEVSDYKKRDNWNNLIPSAAETLIQWTQLADGPPEPCIDSLRSGIKELVRLKL